MKNYAIVTFLIVLSILGLYLIQDILFPFIIGIILSYLFNPLTEWLVKHKVNRSVASAIVVLVISCFLLLILISFIPLIAAQVVSFISQAPKYFVNIKSFIISKIFPFSNIISEESIYSYFKRNLPNYSDEIAINAKNSLIGILSSGAELINFIALIFVTPIVMYYILKDWNTIRQYSFKLIPLKYKESINLFIYDVDKVLSGYLRGQLLVILTMIVYYVVALSILGIHNSIVLGIACGALTLIPYVGAIFSCILCSVIIFFQFNSMSPVLACVLIFVIGQTIESNIIVPRLIGDKINLNPVWLIFAMMTGGTLFGITGIILAVPIAGIVGVASRHMTKAYIKSNFYLN
ncbi:MAG: AI-2E family transporter [Sphingobacteriia bacterium]|nr:AI-2E family transporter [Sphingobacteriia bacterium]